jgi:hypothetical protein
MIPLIRVPPLTQMKTQKGERESCGSGQLVSSEGLYRREYAIGSSCAAVVGVDLQPVHGN